MAFYKTVQAPFGLPLDNRERYTKLDWIVWTATLADNQADFAALVAPVYTFLNESPSRVPMTDWYWTQRRQAARLPGAFGRRRRVHQDAGRSADLEEVVGTSARAVSLKVQRKRARSDGVGRRHASSVPNQR